MESQHTDIDIAFGNVPARPAPRLRLGMLPKMAIVGALACGFSLGLWIAFADDAAPAPESPSAGEAQRVAELLRTARGLYSLGRLMQPLTESALAYSLKILQIDPDSAAAKEVVNAIGDRYLALVADLQEEQNLSLAKTTLAAAQRLQVYLLDANYARRLIEAEARLQAAEQIQQNRRAAANAATAGRYQPLQVFQDRLAVGGQAPPMIFIGGGTLRIGSSLAEPGRDPDEGPQVDVSVQPFAIGQTEVTFAQYDRYVAATGKPAPADNGWGRGDRPVINVSWVAARRYAIWLSQETGYRYRLPTEAEWEFAARAGTTSAFSSGECLAASQANFDDRDTGAFTHCPSSGTFVGSTVAVTAYPPNPWGLFNVHGNVRELLQDCWVVSYSERPRYGGAVFSGEGGQCGAGGARIARGGVWDDVMKSSRSANRFAIEEHQISASVGFRLARDVDF